MNSLVKFAPLFVVLCGILRSTDLFFRSTILLKLTVLTLISWEHLINFIFVIPILIKKRHQYKLLNGKDFLLFGMVGVGASAMGILCFTQAFAFINPALAVLLQKLQPLMTIFLGVVLLKERLSGKFFLWAFIAIIASYFVSFGIVMPFTGEWHKIAKGAFFAILAAFFWGGGTIWGKILLEKYDQLFLVGNRFLFGCIFTLTLVFTVGTGLETEILFADQGTIFWKIFFMALISGLFATTFFYIGLRVVKASFASILELVFPLSSVIIMWKFFDRPISKVQIIAGLVMFFAVFMINKEIEKPKSENHNKA